MKKLIITLMALIMSALFIVPIPALALDFDESALELKYENAPENTAYIDVLIDMDTNDKNYVEFTSAPKLHIGKYDENGELQYKDEDMIIDKDSEIAKFNENGYISLSLHFFDCQSNIIEHREDKRKSESDTVISISTRQDIKLGTKVFTNIKKLHDEYGDFKVAYVDENGKVLQVTETCNVSEDSHGPNTIKANGDKLELILYKGWIDNDDLLDIFLLGLLATALQYIIIFVILGVVAFILIRSFISKS